MGLANHKFFLLFLLYIHLISAHALAATGAHVWACLTPGSAPASCFGPVGSGFLTVLTMCVLAGLFGLFTLCMMIDQSSTLATGLTQIDRHHAARGGAGEKPLAPLWSESLAEVVGGDPAKEGFSIFWLLPTPITYLSPEALTGYCFRDTPRPRSVEEMEALL